MSREEAAAYVGLSTSSFDSQVVAGVFPPPFRLRAVRRRLWDVRAIDAAIDERGAISDMHERERAWQEWRDGRKVRQQERFRINSENRALQRALNKRTK